MSFRRPPTFLVPTFTFNIFFFPFLSVLFMQRKMKNKLIKKNSRRRKKAKQKIAFSRNAPGKRILCHRE